MKILEINEERGKTIVCLCNGTQVVLDDQQIKGIHEIIKDAMTSALSNSMIQTTEKESKKRNHRTSREDTVEKFKVIAKSYKKGEKRKAIVDELKKLFPESTEKALDQIYQEWRKKVGLATSSSLFAKYLAKNDYQVKEENFCEVMEKFQLSSQDLKRETLKIRSLYYV